jgi:hypothetical protein
MATVKTEDLKRAVLAISKVTFEYWVLISFPNNGNQITLTVTKPFYWIFRLDSSGSADNSYNLVCVSIYALIQKLNEIKADEVILGSWEDSGSLELKVDNELPHIILGENKDYYNYPILPVEGVPQGQFCITRENFKAVERCEKYVSIGPNLLSGINFRINENNAIVEATDGYILIQSKFAVASLGAIEFVVPSYFSTNLLKQQWESLHIVVYEDYVMASDEAGSMSFRCGRLTKGTYPSLDSEFQKTMISAVVSKINLHSLLSLLKVDKKLRIYTTILCHQEKEVGLQSKMEVCRIGSSTVNRDSIDRIGTGFAWANIKTKALVKALSLARKKEISMWISDSPTERPVVIIEYSVKECSYTVGMVQASYGENTFEGKYQKALVEYHSPKKLRYGWKILRSKKSK